MKRMCFHLSVPALALAACAVFGLGVQSIPAATNTALHFNGTSQWVTFGSATNLSGSNFTVEVWFRWTGGGTVTGTGTSGLENAIPLVAKGRGEAENSRVDMNYFLGIDQPSGALCADFEQYSNPNAGLNHPVYGKTRITSNVWHHAAATYDGSNWCLYLDGVLDNTLYVGVLPRWDSIQHLSIASALTSTGAQAGYFAGDLDEVRIWNYARSLSEIRSSINQAPSSTTELRGWWGCNDSTGLYVTNTIATPASTGIRTNAPLWTNGAPFDLNLSPNSPVLVAPANNAPAVTLPPQLSVAVSDPNAGQLTASFYGRLTPNVADFSMVLLPDTQAYVTGVYMTNFYNQINWITNNHLASNIAFVAHVGDIVETAATAAEWQSATNALYRLERAGVPYGAAIGNHDQDPKGADQNTDSYNTYFGTNHFRGTSWFGGSTNRNDEHFDFFDVGDFHFIVIFIEFNESATAAFNAEMTWAQSVLETNKDRRAIIVSHAIIYPDGSWSGAGEALYRAFTNCPNVFLMLCGHETGEGRRTMTDSGHRVDIVLGDFQGDPDEGLFKMLRFSPVNNRIYVRTFNARTGLFENLGGDFDIDYGMIPFDFVGSTTAASGSTATVTWNGLTANTSYQWFARVSDNQSITDGPVWSFSTGAPIIDSISAITAPVGGTITISGYGFSPTASQNIVYFGAVRATSIIATATNLIVTVPPGASYAPITVTVNGFTASTLIPFSVTYPDGTLAFEPRINWADGDTNAIPTHTVVADLNGDGKPDVLQLAYYRNVINVFQNVDDGTSFNANSLQRLSPSPLSLESGGGSYGATAADLDGDGRLDVIVADYKNNQLSLFRNTTTPGNPISFATRVDYTVGTNPVAPVVCDFDLDGKLDIIVANYTQKSLSKFLNQSTPGSFSFIHATPGMPDMEMAFPPRSLAAGDLNGDGLPDLIVTLHSSPQTALVFENTSIPGNIYLEVTPAYQAGGESVAIGDWDRDGRPDFVTASWHEHKLAWFTNTTVGQSITFGLAKQETFSTNVNFHAVTLGDLDGDGYPDLVASAEITNKLFVYHNDSGTAGAFAVGSPLVYDGYYNPMDPALGDFDLDGKLDIVFLSAYSDLMSIYRNGYAFALDSTPSTGSRPMHTVMADFDLDNKLDVAVANYNASTISILRNTRGGAALLTSVRTLTNSGANPIMIDAADLNGDNKIDLVSADNSLSRVTVFLNTTPDGSTNGPTFTDRYSYAAQTGPTAVVLKDVNGDNRPDIIVANYSSRSVSILTNNIDGALDADSFVLATAITLTNNPRSLAVGDLDDDNKADIAVGCHIYQNGSISNEQVTVYHNDTSGGTVAFSLALTPLALGGETLAIGDWDLDGKPDIAAGSYYTKTIFLLKNTTTTGSAISFGTLLTRTLTGHNLHTVAMGDLDGDGKLDLAAVAEYSNRLSLFRNDGVSGTFSMSWTPAMYNAVNNPNGLSLGDLDGDNLLDIVFANYYANNISVYLKVAGH